ncbi:MAG: GNAT family N-acetyltransferase [Bacteroidia bacterium]|nr:GNAT family N-acetyltransferase [Bacteroidia bacterium]
MNIKYAGHNDLMKIAKCHQLAFPNSLSSKMGAEFIRDMFKWYLDTTNKFLFYIEEFDECIGYCGGFINEGREAYGSATGMTQLAFSSAIWAIIKKPWLLFHPDLTSRYKFIFSNIIRKLGLKNKKPIKNQFANFESYAGLVVIGVNPKYQKKGIGSKLQIEFESKSKTFNIKKLSLSVKKNNEKAINSYKRNGYVIDKEIDGVFIMKKII